MPEGIQVGSAPTYELAAEDRVPWVLGTQLTTAVGPLARAPDASRVLMVEAHAFGDRLPYHKQKLVLVFAAMRHFRDALRGAGYEVVYLQAPTFERALEEYFAAHQGDTLVLMDPPSHGAGDRLQTLAETAGGRLELVPNELFLSTPAAFDRWARDRSGPPYRQEQFYRWMRTETGVLMEAGEPVGGEWNYDDQNREVPPPGWEPPAHRPFQPDETTDAVIDWVEDRFDTWGELDTGSFDWPVTREQARDRLDHFATERLPEFGDYQDAMRTGEWAMAHSLLSPAINLGLLHPWAVIQRVETAFESGAAPLNAVEGFIRQVLGWREFVRHTYRQGMPDLAEANQLGADRPLPEFYWTGETDMHCLGDSIGAVREHGYAHHIQRLMILANFATILGVDPAALNRWFHATFVDAYHWVTTPNVVEMGAYGAGQFASKPYVASANYVDRMSDYCGDCVYDENAAVGEDACPFNSLYWDFLARHEGPLREAGRMGLVYSHLDRKRESGDLEAVREQATEWRSALGEKSAQRD